MRKFVVLLLIGILSMSLFSLEYGENPQKEISHTYWEAVKNNDIKMTDEEYIENYTKVLPIEGSIEFYKGEGGFLDGVWYGNFSLTFDRLNDYEKEKKPIVSEKNIKEGLYNNIYPMVKTKSGRNDIKYFWRPAANCPWCVFYKFSVDDYTSIWRPIGLPSKRFDQGDVVRFYDVEANLRNPDASKFKIEGIRVIYNCDYDILTSNMQEACEFVNGNKKDAPKLVEAGAKIMDLKDSVFNKISYEEKVSSSGSDVCITSYDKLNFEDKMTSKANGNIVKTHSNEDIYMYMQLKVKISSAAKNINDYVEKKDKTSIENLAKEIDESDLGDADKKELANECQRLLEEYNSYYQIRYPEKKQKMKKHSGKN